jgi:hypothetical protein
MAILWWLNIGRGGLLTLRSRADINASMPGVVKGTNSQYWIPQDRNQSTKMQSRRWPAARTQVIAHIATLKEKIKEGCRLHKRPAK